MAKKEVYFDPVDPKVDFPEMEKEILEYWEKKRVVKKYLNKNRSSKKHFSFLDGPITANNPMGVHHAWGRTYKDLWQRYKNMAGCKQRFQNGFDCQGLWVEVEVEKELGLKSKKDIENLVKGNKKASIAKFVELCKARVFKYADIQTEQSKRLGYFMDWDNSYFTLSDENNYMIWHFLKKCHERGLIYKGRDSVPWCPRCGTAISQHEMLTEDYKEVTHESIILKLPVTGKSREFLLIWTTTPWTIPANIAVAVDKKMEYSLVEGNSGDKFWVATELVDKIFKSGKKKVIKKVKGQVLVGLKYKGPFDQLPAVAKLTKNRNFHTVIATDDLIMPIDTSEGTGLVHIATGAGTEDYRIGEKYNLPVLPVIEEDATYMEGFGFLTGKNAKDYPEVILDYLRKEDEKSDVDWVFDIQKYKHRYPACWRCKTELVWRVVDEWYIKIDPLREDMKAVSRKIRWIPSFGLKRELDWLNNMHDWLISKKRYWGLALPIWECKSCGSFDVIGGKEELQKKATDGWEKFKGNSPHRPHIDEVKIKCKKCGKRISRVPDVGNPWLDAGIVSFSTISKDNKSTPLYLDNKGAWKQWFPADFITESFPGQFKNWFYSLIAMSTVLENKEPFKAVLGFATLLAEDGRPMHKSWGNAIEFNEGADRIGVDVMRWMYTKQNPVENLLFGYRVADETRRKFHLKLWNIYNFFVTYANLLGWRPSSKTRKALKPLKCVNILDEWILSRFTQLLESVNDCLDNYDAYKACYIIEEFVEDLSNWYIRRSRERVGDCFETLYFILVNLMRILAPFTPFMSDVIYKNLTKEESVHLSDWPKEFGTANIKLLQKMSYLRQIIELGHAIRKEKRIAVRKPLSKLTVRSPEQNPGKDLRKLIEDELNVHNVIWKGAKKLEVEFDTKETPELREEAKARELIRKIQIERRKLNTKLTQKINVSNPWIPTDSKITQKIKNKTLTSNLRAGKFKVLVKN